MEEAPFYHRNFPCHTAITIWMVDQIAADEIRPIATDSITLSYPKNE
jgi:hypothetical protein